MMSDTDKLSMIKTILGLEDSSEEKRLMAYLDASKREILAWRYTDSAPEFVPIEYEMTQVYAVIAGYSQSGAENQTAHGENGISRTFKYEDMLAYIRSHVIPMAKVI